MAVEVVHEGRNGVGVGDGTRGQIDWTETNDTINAGKVRCCGGSANRLGFDGEAAEGDRVGVLRAGERAAAVADGDGTARRLPGRRLLALGLSTAPGVGSYKGSGFSGRGRVSWVS